MAASKNNSPSESGITLIDLGVEPNGSNAEIQSVWQTYIPDKQYGVVMSYKDKGSITGTLTYLDDGKVEVYVDIFQVPEDFQRRGIGTTLLTTLAKEAKEHGASSLSGHITSESALRTRAKVFGADKLEFFTPINKSRLDITYEDALKGNVDYVVKNDLTDWA